ncbi:hypothetical protein DC498_03210 [Terrimonas sp.]|uniref:hypothetical protein n=1 Tax=Terrimonas sp. TaxID=1914338 RepID=UPI000D51AA85|nr:hypothetical protein [Terrimonas sp.]PVD53541.1 hypothetical protein DC498_03210 [Terrimonas sp.]
MTHQATQQQNILSVKTFITIITAGFLSLLLFSFTVHKKIADDFLKQLGISKADANSKISSSLLDGYLDAYGVKNIKNIAIGNRTGITNSLLEYTKQYVSSAGFIKEYNALRDQKKPVMYYVKTPEEFQQEIIENAKKSMLDVEQKLKKADAAMKPVFEKTLESISKQLQQAEDPNNKSIAGYRKGYPVLVKNREDTYAKEIVAWETKYPAGHQQFIKQRLLRFMEETRDINFGAELYEKKGVKYFSNPDYEAKSIYWKMAFRAGKEVVEPARTFVQGWMQSMQ